MKKKLFLFLMTLFGIAAEARATNVEVNATNFPDENFRNWILAQDYGADGILTDEEITGVKRINVSSKSIADLKGIEVFTALIELGCYNNRLTALDVSKNTALTWLYCYYNQLTDLDVSKNTKLTFLWCEHNQLTALDVSKNKPLIELHCSYNQLTALDISKNTVLKELDCSYNQLTTLDISKNTALEFLSCKRNQLITLDVSKNTALKSLRCSNIHLETLDISKNTVLRELDCSNNPLTALDVSKNTALSTLYCNNNQLTALDVSKNTTLSTLYCNNNQLTTLDVSKNTALSNLYCYGNSIRGEGMQTLVNGLCDRTETSNGILRVYSYETATDNVMTTEQVAAATAKNWLVLMWDGNNLVDYPGVEPTVTLNKSEAFLEKGKTMTLKATVSPEIEDKSVTWKSSNTSVATVTNKGVVKGIGGGTATITCTSVATGFTATCKVTVGKVSLGKSEIAVEKGKTTTLTATVYPSSLSDRSVTWKSSNTSVATVTSKGVVKGVAGGTATITCTSNATGFTATCKVIVGKVSLNKYEVAIEKGKTTTLTGTVYPSTLEDRSVTWKSSNTSVATVTSKGVVKGIGGGIATITCTSVATGFTATCKVTVGKISLSKYEILVEKGKTTTLTATVYPSALEDRSVTWKSSNTAVATVSSSGKVKGVKSGTAVITCTSNATGFTATCTVTVGTVILNLSEIAINKGKTVTLEADVYPETLEDRSVTWESSDETVATVSSAGKVTSVGGGTATITCTSVATGFTATCQVTVTESASARTLDGDDEEVTGIETIEETPVVEEPYDVYDLKGRKVLQRVTSLDGLPAGIYIVNGKKVLKK